MYDYKLNLTVRTPRE